MEGRDTVEPIADHATLVNLERVVKLLAQGRPVNLCLNGRRVRFSEGSRLEIELKSDARSGTWEIDISWDKRSAENTRRRIGAYVTGPFAQEN